MQVSQFHLVYALSRRTRAGYVPCPDLAEASLSLPGPELREESAKPFRGPLDGWRHKLITAPESQHTPAGASRVGDPLERPPQRTDP